MWKLVLFEFMRENLKLFDDDNHHIHRVTQVEEIRSRAAWSLVATMANYSKDNSKSTPNFDGHYFNKEMEFESRCHFHRVRNLVRNLNPLSLQLTGSTGICQRSIPDSKNRCLTIFLTNLTFFISCRIYNVNSAQWAYSNALFNFFNGYREPPLPKTTPVLV